MPGKTIQTRGSTIANHASFIGASREVTFVTDRNTLRCHDGSTAGGFELAKSSYASISVAGSSNVALTQLQASNPFLEFTGILTGNIEVQFPITNNSGKLYLLKNSTTGSFTLTVIGTSGTGVVLPQSGVGLFSHDGTNMVSAGGSGTTGYFTDGSASAPSISFLADTDTGIYRSGANTLDFATAGSRRWSIGSTGILQSIGAQSITTSTGDLTFSPTGNTVVSSTTPTLKFSDTVNGTLGFIGNADDLVTGTAGKLAIRGESGLYLSSQGNAQTAYLTPNGNLLIGTTSETGLTGAGGLRIGSTTEATTGGAGSIVSLGGIYATKAIISGSATDSTTTATGGAIFAGGVGIGKTLTTSARILTTAIKTTTYTILTTDHVIICNHASTAFTVTLPSLVSATTGRQYIIKNKGAAIVTVDANGSETIDGNLSVDLALYESITVVNDGIQWLIV